VISPQAYLRWLNKVDVCLAEMSPAPITPRVRVTIELSETLYDMLQITAAQQGQTMTALCESALRETQHLPRRHGEQGFTPSPPDKRVAGPGRPPARAQELAVPAPSTSGICAGSSHKPRHARVKPAAWQASL
jgi:hypothetical protein